MITPVSRSWKLSTQRLARKKIEKASNCASCVGEGVIVDSFAAAKICRTSFFPFEAHLWYAIRLRAPTLI